MKTFTLWLATIAAITLFVPAELYSQWYDFHSNSEQYIGAIDMVDQENGFGSYQDYSRGRPICGIRRIVDGKVDPDPLWKPELCEQSDFKGLIFSISAIDTDTVWLIDEFTLVRCIGDSHRNFNNPYFILADSLLSLNEPTEILATGNSVFIAGKEIVELKVSGDELLSVQSITGISDKYSKLKKDHTGGIYAIGFRGDLIVHKPKLASSVLWIRTPEAMVTLDYAFDGLGGAVVVGAGAYYSQNNGSTWEKSIVPASWNDTNRCRTVVNISKGRYFTANREHIFYSVDNGATWTEDIIHPRFSDPLPLDYVGNETIFLARDRTGTILRTTNLGGVVSVEAGDLTVSNSMDDWAVYPNPANDVVSVTPMEGTEEIVVRNLLGETISVTPTVSYKGGEPTVHISGLGNYVGVVFLSCVGKSGTSTKMLTLSR